jgi:hypothetical protein
MPNIILKLKSFTLNLFLDCAEADRFVTERMTSPRRDSEAALRRGRSIRHRTYDVTQT